MCACFVCETLKDSVSCHINHPVAVSAEPALSLYPLEPPRLGKIPAGFWWNFTFSSPFFFKWPGCQLTTWFSQYITTGGSHRGVELCWTPLCMCHHLQCNIRRFYESIQHFTKHSILENTKLYETVNHCKHLTAGSLTLECICRQETRFWCRKHSAFNLWSLCCPSKISLAFYYRSFLRRSEDTCRLEIC